MFRSRPVLADAIPQLIAVVAKGRRLVGERGIVLPLAARLLPVGQRGEHVEDAVEVPAIRCDAAVADGLLRLRREPQRQAGAAFGGRDVRGNGLVPGFTERLGKEMQRIDGHS